MAITQCKISVENVTNNLRWLQHRVYSVWAQARAQNSHVSSDGVAGHVYPANLLIGNVAIISKQGGGIGHVRSRLSRKLGDGPAWRESESESNPPRRIISSPRKLIESGNMRNWPWPGVKRPLSSLYTNVKRICHGSNSPPCFDFACWGSTFHPETYWLCPIFLIFSLWTMRVFIAIISPTIMSTRKILLPL